MAEPLAADYTIEGMSCAGCAARLERVLNRLDHVQANVNFAASQAHLQAATGQSLPDREIVLRAIRDAGFEGIPIEEQRPEAAQERFEHHYRDIFHNFLIALFCSAPLMLVMLPVLHGVLPRWAQLLMASVVQFWCGRGFYRQAWSAMRNKSANMDMLVVLGTLTAYLFSVVVTLSGWKQPVYFDTSAMIITLILLGRLLELRARRQAGSGIEALLKLQPVTAHRECDGVVTDCPVDQLVVGDVVIVRPGEVVPVDGIILAGTSELDESLLTGEAFPVLRQKGDKIYTATLNGGGVLRLQAMEIGARTALARITKLVEQAQGSKAAIQRLADRVSAIFVPVVLGLALLTLIGNWLFGLPFSHALLRTVAVLVVACPCALGLATPAALMVGTARGARAGILFRNAQALERSRQITAMVFDKTGTLTEGKPVLTGISPFAGQKCEELLSLAYALERDSEHPLAEAVRTYAKAHSVSLSEVEEVRAVAGKGVTARLKTGEPLFLGTALFLAEQNILLPEGAFGDVMSRGGTVVFLARGQNCLGALSFEDELRPEAFFVVSTLRKAHIEPVILTGDQEAVAQSVGRKLGITKIHASVLPDQKAQEIEHLRSKDHIIAMVGDGMNDAPALAASDLSFAMGSGAAVALESADIVLVRGGLKTLLDALSLSKATLRRIRQNLFFAFIYNVLCLPLAAFGYLTPVLAASLMALSSVSVVCNALWLNRWSPMPERPEP